MTQARLLRAGVVLFVEHYEACVAFYRDTLGLPLIKDQGNLVILDFGGAYLMVERESAVARSKKTRDENPTVLRFNVENVDVEADRLRAKGVSVAVMHFDWGIVGQVRDPEGNAGELRNHYDGTFAPKA